MIKPTTEQALSNDPTVKADVAQTSLKAGWTILAGLAAAVGVLGLFAFIAFSFGKGLFAQIDLRALAGAYQLRLQAPWLTPFMAAATDIGTVLGLTLQTVIGVALLLWRRGANWRSNTLFLIITMCGVSLLNLLLKEQFGRPRPTLYPSPYQLLSYSFPSGHAMAAATFYGCVTILIARSIRQRGRRVAVAMIAAALTGAIGLSRMYFSVHYPTDVLGGFSAGLGWLIAVQVIWSGITWRRTQTTRLQSPRL